MITLAIPTYNRTDLLFECFKDLIDDDRVSEIVIADDHSEIDIYNQVAEYCSHIPKVKLYRNEKNLDCYRNKREAVSKASNAFVIIADSDNIFTKSYIDAIISGLDHVSFLNVPGTILQPSFAKPHFDFREYSGKTITKENVSEYIASPTFQTMLNAMNFFVNKETFLEVWDGSIDPVTSDSMYFNYCWLKAGLVIEVVHDLEYEHRVHPGSHYQNNVRRTPKGFHESIIQKLKELK